MLDMIKGIGESAKALLTGADERQVEIIDGEAFYKPGIAHQKRFHPTWYLNLAYFLGKHWVEWNQYSQFYQNSAAPTWRVRVTINFIMSNVRTQIAKLLKNSPRFYGMPANDDEESKASAKVASQLFEGRYQEDDTINRLIRLFLWSKITGSAYLFPLWDASLGKQWEEPDTKPVLDPLTGQPVLDADGVPVTEPVLDEAGQPKTTLYAEGDVDFIVENSFCVIEAPGAPEEFAEHKKIMRLKLMDVAEIKEKWNVDVAPESFDRETAFLERMMSLVSGSTFSQSSAEDNGLKNKALVKEMFELPTRAHKHGRHWIYAGDKVLLPVEPLEYWYGGRRALPCAKILDVQIPGQSLGGTTIEQAGPINVQLNKVISAIIENGNAMGRPKVKVGKGVLDDDVWTDQPGELVEFNKNDPNESGPVYMEPPEMPSYVLELKKDLPMILEELFSIHEVSKGRLPRRANSGVAIQSLQDADDTQVGLTIKSIASGLSRAFSIALELMKRKYDEERIVRRIGKKHEIDMLRFKGSDLTGCDSVRVAFGPYLTRAEKIDIGMQLWEKGAISTEDAMEIMELGDLEIAFQSAPGEKQYVEFENMGMAKGIAYPVGPLEDHALHAKGHRQFLLSPTGVKLPPDIRKMIEDHIFTHDQSAPPIPGTPPPAAAPAAPPPSGGPQ